MQQLSQQSQSNQQGQSIPTSPTNANNQSVDLNSNKTTHSIWKEAQLSNKNKDIPSARWGHSFVKAQHDLLYLFGGYAESNYMNDSWTFDLNTFQWKALTSHGIIPEKRSNHSGCYLEKKNKILIFGGGGKEKKRFNDAHLLDISTHCWEYLSIQNSELVTPRTYHTANLFFDQYLAVFGGEGVGDLNDLCILSLEHDPQWILLQPLGKVPPKRRFHSSAVVQNKLYILGGCFSNYRCHDDIWELNLGEYLINQQNITLEWRQIIHYNHVFQPRWGQCSQVYDDKVYIFGGRNLKDLNETIIFDPSKQADCLLKIDQTSPNPRRRGAAVVVGSTIVVFGGFDGIYYNDIHYLNITQTENDSMLKLDNEQHFKFLQNLMYSQQNCDLEIQFNSFKIGIHKIIVFERMNDPKNRQFLSKIESLEKLNLKHRDFEQRFFINTVVQYMYSGVFDYRQIRNQKDLNQLQEFAHEIKLNTLLDALNQSEQWIRQEIQSTLVQRFNNYYFQRYFRFKQLHKKLLTFNVFDKRSKSEQNQPDDKSNKPIKNNSHTSNKNYDPAFVIVNDSIWFEDNEINYQYSDVTLSCEGKQIRANKYLLSSQSLYFKTIFDLGFMEKTEHVINIEIVSFTTLKIILNFVYYHKIILPQCFDINDWLNLIEASKYFQISYIQEVCEIELIKVINTDNLLNLYYSSILYNCPKLRQNCSNQFALKLYSNSIFATQDPIQIEDQLMQQMGIEAQNTYNLLKFQINQDKIVDENNSQKVEQIEIEYDCKEEQQNLQQFLADIHNWEKQEDIINRLKRRNNKQKSVSCYQSNSSTSSKTTSNSTNQNCNCSNNCDQLFLQMYDSNPQRSITHQYDSSDNSCKNKQTNIFLSAESDKFAQNQTSKGISQLFQTQDFTVFSGNNYQQEKQTHNQRGCKNMKQRLSLNSTLNYENSVCLSGRSHDSIQYGANPNVAKNNSDNCHSDFNADSDDYDLQNNAMIEEGQTYQQYQNNIEFSL